MRWRRRPALQAKLADALARSRAITTAAAHSGGPNRRKETRTVRAGYVVGAPLWKAS